MSAVTWENRSASTGPSLRTRARHLRETVRYAPAPYFEGSARQRLHYVTYLVGSAVAFGAGGLAVSAALGRALGAL